MSLAEEFNDNNYGRKVNDFVLSVNYSLLPGSSSQTYYQYDFLARILTTRPGGGDGGVVVTPFSQLDPESLEHLRSRLIDLGGKPPPLSPTLNKPQRGLNP